MSNHDVMNVLKSLTLEDIIKLVINDEKKNGVNEDKQEIIESSKEIYNIEELIEKYPFFTRYNIKAQFAQRIDKFFDMYGYATNDLKIPNISNRPNWNYIKLAGANLLGEIPEADLQEIKSLFNEGITLWHNATTFLDYSQNNR